MFSKFIKRIVVFYLVRKVDALIVGTINGYKTFLEREVGNAEHGHESEDIGSPSKLEMIQSKLRFSFSFCLSAQKIL